MTTITASAPRLSALGSVARRHLFVAGAVASSLGLDAVAQAAEPGTAIADTTGVVAVLAGATALVKAVHELAQWAARELGRRRDRRRTAREAARENAEFTAECNANKACPRHKKES